MVNKKLSILFLFSVLLAFFAGYFSSRILPFLPLRSSDGIIEYIEENLERIYYYDLDDDAKYDAYIQSMEAVINAYAKANNDPYTRLVITPKNVSPTDDEKFVGIGISFVFEENNLRIQKIIKGSAAENVLYPNDLIIGIKLEDEEIIFNDLNDTTEVISYLSGTLDDEKNLIVMNPDFIRTERLITYQEVLTPSVNHIDLLDDDISYIKINKFTSFTKDVTLGSARVFLDILNDLESTKLTDDTKTLIIDVRDNPGGALSALHNSENNSLTQGILQQLLTFNIEYPIFKMIPKSEVVVNFYGGLSSKKPYDIKILVNENSASASEVLAAALNTNGGYAVYGNLTFGKGVYQNQFTLQTPYDTKKGVQISIVYTEGKWFYGDDLNVELNPINVQPIEQDGIKSLLMPIYNGVMSFDMVNSNLANYQKFFNYYYNLTGIDKLRTDGYFDQKTKDVVIDFNTSFGLIDQEIIDYETQKFVHQVYMEHLFDLSRDVQLQSLISIIKND
jgi:carboxyl-terminal processing protease